MVEGHVPEGQQVVEAFFYMIRKLAVRYYAYRLMYTTAWTGNPSLPGVMKRAALWRGPRAICKTEKPAGQAKGRFSRVFLYNQHKIAKSEYKIITR